MDFEEFVTKQLSDIPIPKEGKTVQEVFDELTEEQKKVVYFLIGSAIKDATETTLNGFEVFINQLRRSLS